MFQNFKNFTLTLMCYFFLYSYVVLPEWYVHDEPGDDSTEVAMETNENELSNGQEAKKKPMLGYDTMTIWERSVCQLLPHS
jgi:hypothetical protein